MSTKTRIPKAIMHYQPKDRKSVGCQQRDGLKNFAECNSPSRTMTCLADDDHNEDVKWFSLRSFSFVLFLICFLGWLGILSSILGKFSFFFCQGISFYSYTWRYLKLGVQEFEVYKGSTWKPSPTKLNEVHKNCLVESVYYVTRWNKLWGRVLTILTEQ